MTFSKGSTKLIVVVLGVVLMFAFIALYIFPSASASMNIEDTGDHVRIYVGEIDHTSLRSYSKTRSAFLAEIAANDPSGIYSAVVPLNDYYTEDEINQLISDYDLQIERAYLWAPGETGKVSLAVSNNDIASAKRIFLDQIADPNNVEQTQDMERLTNGEFKIYALTIQGTAQRLEQLQVSVSQFAAVDVKYNLEAEQYALQRGKTFSYIEEPSKPDGAL